MHALTATESRILAELAEREMEIATRPEPPSWRHWERVPLELDRELGPVYSPRWFGDETATNAGRQRFLRAIYALEQRGLLVIVRSEGGRLERLKLTEAGAVGLNQTNATT
jgi:hypothetical protein